jgi:hypothetical protein
MADSERSLRDDSLRRNRGGGVLTIHSPTELPVYLLSDNFNSVGLFCLKETCSFQLQAAVADCYGTIDYRSVQDRSTNVRRSVHAPKN